MTLFNLGHTGAVQINVSIYLSSSLLYLSVINKFMNKSVTCFALSASNKERLTQRRNHVFKVGGPIPWSIVLLPFYRKKRQVYPVWCSGLHNHSLFIKKLCKKFGGPSKFWGGPDPLTPSGCAHGLAPHRHVSIC